MLNNVEQVSNLFPVDEPNYQWPTQREQIENPFHNVEQVSNLFPVDEPDYQ